MPVSTSTSIRRVSRSFEGGSLQTIRDSTSTGVGIGYDFGVKIPANYALMAIGASTAWRMSLQGSADATKWTNLITGVGASTTPTATRSTHATPFQFLRSVVTAGTTSTSVLVNAYILANAAGVDVESTAATDAVNVAQVGGSTVKLGKGTSTGGVLRTVEGITSLTPTMSTDKSVTSTAPVTVLAANSNRKEAIIQNTSTAGNVRVSLSTTNPTATKGIQLRPGASLILSGPRIQTGAVEAIRESTGTSKVGVTESS